MPSLQSNSPFHEGDIRAELSRSQNFENLTGQQEKQTVSKILSELNAVGVSPFNLPEDFSHPDVKTKTIGVLEFVIGPILVFERQWRYWSVKATSPLDRSNAVFLNQQYGDEVRVDGHGHGKLYAAPLLEQGFLPNRWHVDTPRGLLALVESYRQIYGPQVEYPDLSFDTIDRICRNRTFFDRGHKS